MLKYLLLFISAILFFSCTEEKNITNVNGFDRTLVIIADDEPSSDMILKIKGAVTDKHSDVNIQYFQAKPFDIEEASYLLEMAANNYPDDTYFAVIVEPELNTEKIIFKSNNRTVIAPDNGVSTRFRKIYPADKFYLINNIAIFGDNYKTIDDVPSDIFYSESIVNMLSDVELTDFGTEFSNPVNLEITEPSYINGVAKGEVLYVNNFGNCETNISDDIMSNFNIGDILEIETENDKFYAYNGTTYGSVQTDLNVAMITGNKKLRLAVNYGNIADRYNLKAGTELSVKKANIKAGILLYNNSDLAEYIKDGLISKVNNTPVKNNINFIIKSAEGKSSELKNLVEELINEDIDVIIPVSTPASQAAIEFTPNNIPVVFTYVTSPEFAGILDKRVKVTGLSDATNIDDYLDFVKRLMPDLMTAGRLYNPNEANSAYFQSEFLKKYSYYNLTQYTEQVTQDGELDGAFTKLASYNPEAILIGADNTMNYLMQNLSQKCIDSNIPLIGDSFQNTQDGALASISVDYSKLSEETGNYIYQVLLGKNPDDMEIKKFGNTVISLNKLTAGKIGFTFSQDLMDDASDIVE